MEAIPAEDLASREVLIVQYSVGSVFIEEYDGRLLVTDIHPGREDIRNPGKWSPLRFPHVRASSSSC